MTVPQSDLRILKKRGLHYFSLCSETLDQLTCAESIAIYALISTLPEGTTIDNEEVLKRLSLSQKGYLRGLNELKDLDIVAPTE